MSASRPAPRPSPARSPAPRPSPPLDSNLYDIVIVAGQSNSVGRGSRNVCDSIRLGGGCSSSSIDLTRNSSRLGAITDVSGYDFIDGNKVKMFTCNGDLDSDPNLQDALRKMITDDGFIPSTHYDSIIPMREPLESFQHRPHTDTDISFASSFANEYIKTMSAGRKLLIVGCGISAASINEWRDEYHAMTLTRLTRLRNRLTSTNTSKVVAFLWHQGESDTSDTLLPDYDVDGSVFRVNDNGEPYTVGNDTVMINKKKNIFKFKLQKTLSRMRTDIIGIFTNNNSNYRFPILIGGLSYDIEINRKTGMPVRGKRVISFSNLMSEISNPTDLFYLEKSAFVSSGPILSLSNFARKLESNAIYNAAGQFIPYYEDNVHFSASSMREFGKRYFYYYNLIK
jgi:hypothetical protein